MVQALWPLIVNQTSWQKMQQKHDIRQLTNEYFFSNYKMSILYSSSVLVSFVHFFSLSSGSYCKARNFFFTAMILSMNMKKDMIVIFQISIGTFWLPLSMFYFFKENYPYPSKYITFTFEDNLTTYSSSSSFLRS